MNAAGFLRITEDFAFWGLCETANGITLANWSVFMTPTGTTSELPGFAKALFPESERRAPHLLS